MSRSSYFQRIARADRSGAALRPPPAVFRRWEMTQVSSARPQPAAADQSPISAAPRRKLSQSSAASPGLRTAIQLPGTELPAAPDHTDPRLQPPKSDRPTEKDTTPAVKSSVRADPVQAEVQPGRNLVQRKQRAKPEAARAQINAPRSVNSTAPGQRGSNVSNVSNDANLPPNPSRKSERAATRQTLNLFAREAIDSSTDETIATPASEAPGPRKSDETPRLLQTHYRSHERREPIPAPPLARLQAAEKSQPTVKIGTIDVQITPPPAAMPQPKMARSSSRKPANSLSRGFTSSFGLRQG